MYSFLLFYCRYIFTILYLFRLHLGFIGVKLIFSALLKIRLHHVHIIVKRLNDFILQCSRFIFGYCKLVRKCHLFSEKKKAKNAIIIIKKLQIFVKTNDYVCDNKSNTHVAAIGGIKFKEYYLSFVHIYIYK